MDSIYVRVRTPAPRVAPRDLATRDLGPRVLNGCCIEAERADRVAFCLKGLRDALEGHQHLHPHLTAVIDELQNTSRLLRDLADKSQVHISQVPVMIDYLNVILPCLCRTLRDIMGYYEDKSMSKDNRWRTMYHRMGAELPGTTLPARFVMYNQFLQLLDFMLRRDPNFDVNGMELLRVRILQLRDARGIDPPTPIRTDLVRRHAALDFWQQETDSHWAEAIFTHPLPSRREFTKRGRSDAFGPLDRMGYVRQVPHDVKILVKRSFDNDQVSIIIFLREADQIPFILVRTRTQSIQPWVAIRPVFDLIIERESASVLCLSYWNDLEQRCKPWACLSFLTWEELVLFYCTFVCLKVRNERTVQVDRHELKINREKVIFRAQIIDDGYDHCLRVVKDKYTEGHRLHVTVEAGPLKGCPVWTAFIPPDITEDWLIHKDSRKVWLRNLQVYSFSDEYRPYRQRRGRSGAFELKFAHVKGASSFMHLFNPIPAPSVEDASEDRDDPTLSD